MLKRVGWLCVVMGFCAVVTCDASDRDPRFGSPQFTFPKDSSFSLTLLTEFPSSFCDEVPDRAGDDNEHVIQERIEPSIVFAPVCPPPFVAIEQTAAEEVQTPQAQEETHDPIELSILFTPSSDPPCELNPQAIAIASELDEQEARQRLDELQQQLADVIRLYPHTKAATDAEGMLKAAGLKVYSDGSIAPLDYFSFGYADITR